MLRKPLYALAALLLAGAALANFTPPTDLTPFEPQNCGVSVDFAFSVGTFNVYDVFPDDNSPAFTIVIQKAMDKGDNAEVIGSANLSWHKFQKATLVNPSPADVLAAQNFWQNQVDNPFFGPLITK